MTTTGPGGSRPDRYTYDETGNLVARDLAGVGESFVWDDEECLAEHAKAGQWATFRTGLTVIV